MIHHIPALLTSEQVHHLRTCLAECDWVDGKQTVGLQGAQVKHNRQLPEHAEVTRELGEIILAALQRNPLFVSAALPLRIVPPLFNAYSGGEHYGFHVDGAIRSLPYSDGRLRTDLSSTVFLCGPEEYEGGELEIIDSYGTHEVKLAAGDMILYPSTSLHQVRPVTRGVRVCSFFWTQSMVRDDARRNLLFEMDQSIQTLRAQQGDTAPILQLTAQYHNLLRMWAET